ncbi:MAG: hypothetical protein ACI837_001720 [Crocinitomicaceae bacterium]|jgi:hypothetical protein
MKSILTIALLLIAGISFGQRDLNPRSNKNQFGKVDLRKLRKTGFQFQLGPAYSFTKGKNQEQEFNNAAGRGSYITDPGGRFGAYAELGLFHYTKKPRKLINYLDWGVGFKYLGGKEKTTINYADVLGNVVSTDEDGDGFYNGYLYGRVSVHKILKPKNSRRFFFDVSLGANVDYRLITADQNSNYHTNYASQFSEGTAYHGPLVAQLHAGLGFGFKLRSGTDIIPGFRVPIFGINEWQNGNPSLQWFSSRYLPVLFHVKIQNLFQKRTKGSCPAVDGNEDDKKRNNEYMQGN